MITLGAPHKWSDSSYSLPKPKWWQFISVDRTYDCRGGLCPPVHTIYTFRVFWIVAVIQIKAEACEL